MTEVTFYAFYVDLPSYPVSGELNQGNTRPEEDPLNLTSAGGGQPLTGDKYGDKSDLYPSGDIGGSRVYNDDDVTGSAPQRSGGDYNEPTGGSGIYNDDDTTGSAPRSSGDNYDEPTLSEERRRTKPTMGQKIKGTSV